MAFNQAEDEMFDVPWKGLFLDQLRVSLGQLFGAEGHECITAVLDQLSVYLENPVYFPASFVAASDPTFIIAQDDGETEELAIFTIRLTSPQLEAWADGAEVTAALCVFRDEFPNDYQIRAKLHVSRFVADPVQFSDLDYMVDIVLNLPEGEVVRTLTRVDQLGAAED